MCVYESAYRLKMHTDIDTGLRKRAREKIKKEEEGPRAREILRTDKELRRRRRRWRRYNRFLIYSDRSIINALIQCEMKACRRVNNTAAS